MYTNIENNLSRIKPNWPMGQCDAMPCDVACTEDEFLNIRLPLKAANT